MCYSCGSVIAALDNFNERLLAGDSVNVKLLKPKVFLDFQAREFRRVRQHV